MEEYNKGWLHRIGETQTMDYSEVVEKEEEINNIPSSIIFRDGQKFINLLKQSKGGVIYYTPEGKYSEFKKEFEEEFESWKISIDKLPDELKKESIEVSKDLLQEFITKEEKENIIDLYKHYYQLIGQFQTGPKISKQDKLFSEFIIIPQKELLIEKLHIWLDGKGGKEVANWIYSLQETESVYFESREEFIRAMKYEFNISGSKIDNRSITKHLDDTENKKLTRTTRHREVIEQIKNNKI